MTNQIALWLAGLIILLCLADFIFDDGQALLFLAMKTTELVQYVAFWR